MGKEEEFKDDKEKMVEVEETLSEEMSSGLFELKDLVQELRDIRDSQFTRSTRFKGGPSLDGGHFNQLLRNLEESLTLCLEEYKRMNALKNLGEAMAMDVVDRVFAERKEKIDKDMAHFRSTEYGFNTRE